MNKKACESQQIALVLGGTAPHIELIKELHRRGYWVILIDYFENPPAKKYADLHVNASTLDKESVLKIAKENNASLVISACIDQANSICCYVAEQLGLPHPYSYVTSVQVTDKSEMKKTMVENNIPTSWFYTVNDIEDIPWNDIVFPAVVKPVDCNSSKGVHRVESSEDGKKYVKEAISLSRRKRAIVEGFVEGTEIQVDCFAGVSSTQIILTRQKKRIQGKNSEELNSEGSILPAPVCKGKEREISIIANKIASAFGLRNTPFFFQAIVDRNGGISVLEFAPRVGGGLSYYILKNIAGFDAIRAVVNSYIGEYEIVTAGTIDRYYSTNLLYMTPGIFDHIDGFDQAKKKGLIVEGFITKEKGTAIGSNLSSGNRVGAFIVEGDSVEALKAKETQVYSIIDVIDIDGKSQMRRWVE